jgi:DNA-binding transcriptional LysR family regulator
MPGRASVNKGRSPYMRQAQPVDVWMCHPGLMCHPRPGDTLSSVEVRQLRYVVAVAEELHFGHAAERLNVAQQSVSEQIRRLEGELGTPLFIRTSRYVVLTSAGEAFVPAARRALRAIDEAADIVQRVARGTSGQLRVGYAGDLGQRLIQHVVPRLSQLEVPVQIQPEPMSTPHQLVALSEGRLDLAFGWTPELTEDVVALTVTHDPLVIAIANGHPLAALRTIAPKDLSRWPLVLAPRALNPQLYERTIGQLVAEGAVLTIHREIAGLDRMLPLVIAGAAIAITCSTTAGANPSPGVKYLRFSEPVPWVDHILTWRADNTGSTVRSFVDVVRDLRDEGVFLPPAEL